VMMQSCPAQCLPHLHSPNLLHIGHQRKVAHHRITAFQLHDSEGNHRTAAATALLHAAVATAAVATQAVKLLAEFWSNSPEDYDSQYATDAKSVRQAGEVVSLLADLLPKVRVFVFEGVW